MPTQNDDETDGSGSQPSAEPTGVARIEAYETDEGVVFYDAENPLAWVEAAQPLTLEECA